MTVQEQGSSLRGSTAWRPAFVCLVSPIVVFVSASISLVAMTACVPRRNEGSRSVPDVSWTFYASTGNLAAIVISLLVLGVIFRRSRERIAAWLLAFASCWFCHELFLTDMLRRDFIGKF